MSTRKNDPDARLDEALAGIRQDVPDPERIRAAEARVWTRILDEAGSRPSSSRGVDTIRGCEDVRALLGAYVGGSLPAAKSILVEDHTRECVPCRRALRDLRSGSAASSRAWAPPTSGRRAFAWWGVAAASLLVTAMAGYAIYWNLPAEPALAAVRVQSIEGALYRVSGNWSASASVGEEITGGQVFRTAKGSRAVVRLADGSGVELNERS
jgi:hypothetical protein